jgi:ribonucleotide reductase, class II
MFLRRMTFRRNDPVALACIELGYSVIPSQADKDEHNQLLADPFDPRCTEWLVEIPIATSWADLEGVEEIDISKFSATAQLDFYMGVQEHYTRHNTSATIELREEEILPLATAIYQAIQKDKGYISAALLQRFDTDFKSYPRLPFEPISKETYHRLVAEVAARNSGKTFAEALAKYDNGDLSVEVGPSGCDGDKCLLADIKPSAPLADDINALFI